MTGKETNNEYLLAFVTFTFSGAQQWKLGDSGVLIWQPSGLWLSVLNSKS